MPRRLANWDAGFGDLELGIRDLGFGIRRDLRPGIWDLGFGIRRDLSAGIRWNRGKLLPVGVALTHDHTRDDEDFGPIAIGMRRAGASTCPKRFSVIATSWCGKKRWTSRISCTESPTNSHGRNVLVWRCRCERRRY